MSVLSESISIKTKGEGDARDITGAVASLVESSPLQSGIATVFVPGSTGGVTTIEYEPGAVSDLGEVLEKIAPRQAYYRHNETWGDGNGYAHVRAAVLGPSLTVPFQNKALMLGTWQQIIFIDFDNRSRSRTLIVHLIGE